MLTPPPPPKKKPHTHTHITQKQKGDFETRSQNSYKLTDGNFRWLFGHRVKFLLQGDKFVPPPPDFVF